MESRNKEKANIQRSGEAGSTTELAVYLRRLRREHDYSQAQIAQTLGIIRQTYSHYETGRIIPPMRSLAILAHLYNVDVTEFTERMVPQSVRDCPISMGAMDEPDMIYNMHLAEYLRKLRKDHGYSQSELADMLGVIQQTYSHYETGRIVPPVQTLCRLSELYGVSIDDMLRKNAGTMSGHTDQGSQHSVRYISRRYLADDEQELIDLYSELSGEEKERVLNTVRDYALDKHGYP